MRASVNHLIRAMKFITEACVRRKKLYGAQLLILTTLLTYHLMKIHRLVVV